MQSDARFVRLVQSIDATATLSRVWSLEGGVSSQTHVIEVESSGQIRRFVVRRHGRLDLNRNPHIASDEYHVLKVLHAAGLAVPAPILFDESFGAFESPVIVIEYIDGTSEMPEAHEDCVAQMAAQLAELHSLSTVDLSLPVLQRIDDGLFAEFRRAPGENDGFVERRIRSILSEFSAPPARQKSCLLHGDFWPGNILWKGGRLVALVDWEDAAIGSPLSDLANARLEILWSLGYGATLNFTRRYLALTHVSAESLPWWDLFTVLKVAGKIESWGLSPGTETRMRELCPFFVEQAIDQLTSSQSG